MRSVRSLAALVLSFGTLAATIGFSPASAATVGEFAGIFSESGAFNSAPPLTEDDAAKYPTAVSMAVLPDGNVVFWNGLKDTEHLSGPLAASIPPNQNSETRHLDLSSYFSTGAVTSALWTSGYSTPTPEDGGGGDLFCSDQRLLSDGRVLVVGGSWWSNEDETVTNGTPAQGLGRTDIYGRTNVRVYDGASNTWTQLDSMHKGRWYPALLTLPDGKMLVLGGVGRLMYNSKYAPGMAPPENDAPENQQSPEIFDPSAPAGQQWTLLSNDEAQQSLPLFARVHLLPNGKVLYDASGQMWGPAGEDVNELEWNWMRTFDPATKSWSQGDVAPLGARSGTFSVMLPLKPDSNGNYTRSDILVGGGVLGTSPGLEVAVPITEKISVNGDTITRSQGPNLNAPRWFSSSVALPSGEVLALNGGDIDEVIWPGSERAVRLIEMYDPKTDSWKPLVNSLRDRTYHNSALLLKDGSVLIGGHSPIVNGYGQDHANTPVTANNFKDPSFEIYKPPYLFRGDRPAITGVGTHSWARGSTVSINTSDAGNETLQVVLSRVPTTTHVTDADQRTVYVAHTQAGDDEISVTVPTNGAALPPGPYYVFLMKDNGQGLTPSVAEIVNITA